MNQTINLTVCLDNCSSSPLSSVGSMTLLHLRDQLTESWFQGNGEGTAHGLRGAWGPGHALILMGQRLKNPASQRHVVGKGSWTFSPSQLRGSLSSVGPRNLNTGTEQSFRSELDFVEIDQLVLNSRDPISKFRGIQLKWIFHLAVLLKLDIFWHISIHLNSKRF